MSQVSIQNYYSPFLNLVLYQLIWVGAVLAGEQLTAALCLLIVFHVYLSRGRLEELLVMSICASIGLIADSLLAVNGVYEFTHLPEGFPVPLWLVVLWFAFAGTLRNGLAYFMKRPVLAVLAAAIGAPLSYLAAGRLGAVAFPLGSLRTAIVVGSIWILLICVFVIVTRTVSRTLNFQGREPVIK